MTCISMETSKVTLKLLVDTKNHKVLFAEAGKDFVDFLFLVLSLPLATIISLLEKNTRMGSLDDLYESIQNLSQTYIQEGKDKDSLLKPGLIPSDGTPLVLPSTAQSSCPNCAAPSKIFVCSVYSHTYASNSPDAICPSCSKQMKTQMSFVSVPAKRTQSSSVQEGFVKGLVTYMVTDNLEVTPMSTTPFMSSLNRFNVKDLNALEEKVVDFGMPEGLELLKASLQTKSVLTSIFLGQKDVQVAQVSSTGNRKKRAL